MVEQGTYDQLVNKGGAFSRLLQEFSGQNGDDDDPSVETELEQTKAAEKKQLKKDVTLKEVKQKLDLKNLGKAAGTGKIEGRLMKAEKRTIGSIDYRGRSFRSSLIRVS